MTRDCPQVQGVPSKEQHVMDSSWHIPFLGALVIFFADLFYRISGLLFVEIIEEFGVNREQASWPVNMIPTAFDMGGLAYGLLSQWFSLAQTALIGALLTSLGAMSSVLISNIWWMTLTLGLIHGLGSGTINVCVQVFVSQNFSVYRGVAHGIVNSASSVSTFVFENLMLFLISRYNFKASIFLLGSVLLNLIPLSALLGHHFAIVHTDIPLVSISDISKTSVDASNEEKKVYGTLEDPASTFESKPSLWRMVKELLLTPFFYVNFLSWLVMCLNLDMIMTTIVDFAKDIGFSELKAAALLSYFGITDTLGRLLIPLIADMKLVRRSTLSAFNFLVAGLLVAALGNVSSYVILVIVTLLLAASTGCSQSMFGALLADYIGLERLAAAYGLCSVLAAPFLLLKPLVTGSFRDTIGSYVGMFRILAVLQIMNSCLWFAVLFKERKQLAASFRE